MRKPVVDYRGLRFSNLTHPQYNHLFYLLGWVWYLVLYLLTENLIPAEQCYPVYAPLDDLIPFCEWFLIPYAGWYLFIVGTLLYFGLYNPKSFKDIQTYIIITQTIAMLIYVLFPTRQDLRPEVFPRDNLLTDLTAFLYSFDTNTGVCPSLHVAYSLGLISVWVREHSISKPTKTIIVAFLITVCLSVSFVKQHSVWDILAALPLSLLAEFLVFIYPRLRTKAKQPSTE